VSHTAAKPPVAGEAAPPPDPLLAALAEMPNILSRAAVSLDAEALRRPGPDGAFSLVEHAWHLADLEREGYGERLRRLQSESEPHLPDFDGARVARERDYRSLSFEDGLRAFSEVRTRNLALLRTLTESSWSREGTQEGVGRVRLADVPRLMAEHDAGHRAEIEALVVYLRRR
jgi:DinB superfamily